MLLRLFVHPVDAQHTGGHTKLGRPHTRQITRLAPERGRLAMGEAQHIHVDATRGEPIHQRAKAKRLVVRVRHDHQQPAYVTSQRRTPEPVADGRIDRLAHDRLTIPTRTGGAPNGPPRQ